MRDFLDATGAIAICGYTKQVDWLDAGGFEIMLLSAVARATAGKSQRVGAAIKRLRRESGWLLETLGFVSEPNWGGSS